MDDPPFDFDDEADDQPRVKADDGLWVKADDGLWVKADDELWDKHKRKGEQFADAFAVSDADAAKIFHVEEGTMHSQWQGDLRSELAEWGWTEADVQQEFCNFDSEDERGWGIKAAMKALKLNGKPKEDGGDNECFKVEHAKGQTYKVGKTEYQKTGASFQFAVNQKRGVLFGQYLYGAAYEAEKNKAHLPDLRYLADIMYGFWFRGNPDLRNLRYYWLQECSNDETVKIIKRALKNKEELENWPGTTFNVDTDEGAALLGSPIGATIGYLLITHKAELGNKRVSKIQVFVAKDDGDQADLLFHIEDIEDA